MVAVQLLIQGIYFHRVPAKTHKEKAISLCLPSHDIMQALSEMKVILVHFVETSKWHTCRYSFVGWKMQSNTALANTTPQCHPWRHTQECTGIWCFHLRWGPPAAVASSDRDLESQRPNFETKTLLTMWSNMSPGVIDRLGIVWTEPKGLIN